MMRPKIPLASFYTPRDIAQILANWAITDPHTTVLDPSFGGCAFLISALERLRHLGNNEPGKHAYGVDIDLAAQDSIHPILATGASRKQFRMADFFDVHPRDFDCGLFGTILGNPPYIRYHDIPKKSKEKALARLSEFGIQISGRASYWAFFLLYAMRFLRSGGRLAMVLPGAFLHTDYSAEVRRAFTQFFEEVVVLLLQERVFENTEEESVLILASGARKPHKSLRIGAVAAAHDLPETINHIEVKTRMLVGEDNGDGGWLRGLLDSETLVLYDSLTQSQSVIRLGDWVTARIGVVTGDNQFFVLSRTEQREKRISDKYVVPIIRKPSCFSGLWVTDEDLNPYSENGNKALLLTLAQNGKKIPKPIRDYLRLGKKEGTPNAQKCRTRNPWYVVPQTFVPSAFIQCMSAAWPRIVVNRSQFTCTNNILRLSWKKEEKRDKVDWLRLAIGTLSTLSQLSAELVGRSYGGGVLKVEPTELGSLVVPLVPAAMTPEIACQVDGLIRLGKWHEATEVVDRSLSAGVGFGESDLEHLRAARDLMFCRRRQHRGDAKTILENQS